MRVDQRIDKGILVSMTKNLLNRVTGLFTGLRRNADSTNTSEHTPASRIIPEDIHQISRHDLNNNALSVVYNLNDAGHEAYLVGGCIRDLLLGQKPKDFDVATAAHPDVAQKALPRARLIGRRFKLVHVRFGRELIEVATFRAGHEADNTSKSEHGKQNAAGLIVRDNVYGSITDDAMRRDFTVNALYYNVNDHSVYDYANGYEDIQRRVLRMIGDPQARYREDPVRMLRAARFAAKLGFEVEKKTAKPIPELAHLLKDISPARLFDESLKLFQSGYGTEVYHQLQRFNLFVQLYPLTDAAIKQGDTPAEALLLRALQNTDKRVQQGKSITPAFLYAALLWYPLTQKLAQIEAQSDMPTMAAFHEAAKQVLMTQVSCTSIPKRFSATIKEIWELQLRFPRRSPKAAATSYEHPRFRAAYDLLILREQSGEDLDGLGQWWTNYQKEHKPPQRQPRRYDKPRNEGRGRRPRRDNRG
ncbi:MAG: polynucleotide adenylyltransferase PcnB [Pontibacterium sp.]